MLCGSSVYWSNDFVGAIKLEGNVFGVVAILLTSNKSSELSANVWGGLKGEIADTLDDNEEEEESEEDREGWDAEEPVELADLALLLLIVDVIWSCEHTPSSPPADPLFAKATSALLYLKNGEFDTSPVGVGGLGTVSFDGIKNRAEK